MTYVPIEKVEIENYGCIKKTFFQLSPLHALIGPNDSGKSTVLKAVRAAAQFATGKFEHNSHGVRIPFDPMLGENTDSSRIGIRYADDIEYAIHANQKKEVTEVVYEKGTMVAKSVEPRGWNNFGLLSEKTSPVVAALIERLALATMVRFDPDFLRVPVQLIPDSQGIVFTNERGTGLAGVASHTRWQE